MKYLGVMSHDTVQIGFLMAALNGLDIISRDIQIVLLEEPTQEKIFFYAENKWKSGKDRFVEVIHALYGLKSSALQFRNHL